MREPALPQLTARHLTKAFNGVRAVDAVSSSIPDGASRPPPPDVRGAGEPRHWSRAVGMLVASGLAIALSTALGMGLAFAVSLLRRPSGHETIGVMVFALQYEGNSTAAAAVAVLSTGLVFALCAAANAGVRWLPERILPWRQ